MCIAGRSLAVVFGMFLLVGPWAMGQGPVGEPDADGFIALQPEAVSPEIRDELTRVYITGHPDEPGIYVYRNRFAPGGSSRPHFHSQDRYITVIEGTWWVALGPDAAVYDPEKMVPMKAGSFVKHPAGGIHYDGAKGEAVIVEITGMGPVTSTQLNPEAGPE
jgi:quercetin dioxygenase-like cupin family protein